MTELNKTKDIYDEFLNKFVIIDLIDNDKPIMGFLSNYSDKEVVISGDNRKLIINRLNIKTVKIKTDQR